MDPPVPPSLQRKLQHTSEASRAKAAASQFAARAAELNNQKHNLEALQAAAASASVTGSSLPTPIADHSNYQAPVKYGQAAIGRGRPFAGGMRRIRPNFNIHDIHTPDPNSPEALLNSARLGAGRPDGFPVDPNSPFANFYRMVDASGNLNFNGKAILHAEGVNFANGKTFSISMGQMKLYEELGKGNYGTVKKVLHLPTNVFMALKEIRLELEKAKLNGILMELDILHRAVAPEIVEFYGAFFIESCVYYCMEYMDAGSIDKLEGVGVPEGVLGRIACATVKGLKFLKEELNIIHRDVKPTNLLINRRGIVKICDFGISGQLEKSLAKTNIGCQSYMAPERIQPEDPDDPDAPPIQPLGTYTVASDVWSLGLSLIEIGLGAYPFPKEWTILAQLTAIVKDEPPQLSADKFGPVCRDFVDNLLRKKPEERLTYKKALEHPFLSDENLRDVDMVGWVEKALIYKETQRELQRAGK